MIERTEQKLEPGHRLDRYELLCPIAQGGMASVWLARQHGKHGFEKLVAVKTILPIYATDLRFQQMFLDEARIASGIEHPNVAQILDLGDEGDVLYLSMEWVDGDSLSKLFRAAEKLGQQIPTGVLCRIIADTCAGLHAAHELRDKNGELLHVVHRDVSPQNILVSTKGQAKLIDFGIAKARDRVAGETNTGFLKGKILYMPPEQAFGKAVDRRADVWAIGAVLYHLLAGVPPFEGANQIATLHLLTGPDAPPPLPAYVPDPIVDIVGRALVKDPDQRIATAEELQRMIEWAMHASGCPALSSDVAAFVNQTLADRVAARRKAMNLALDAAKHRQKLHLILKPSDVNSASGIGRALTTRTSGGAPTEPEALSSSDLQPDVPSSATLGSAALVTPSTPMRAMSRRKPFAFVGAVVGSCAVLGAMAAGVFIARSQATRAVNAAPAASESPAPTATMQKPIEIGSPNTAEVPSASAAAPDKPLPVQTAREATSVVPTATAPRADHTAHVEHTTTTHVTQSHGSKAAPSATTVDDGF